MIIITFWRFCYFLQSSMPSLAEAFAQPTYKQPQQFSEQESHKNKGKKKKKMTKVDSSVLGFTVHAAPDRINIGEIEQLDGHWKALAMDLVSFCYVNKDFSQISYGCCFIARRKKIICRLNAAYPLMFSVSELIRGRH